MQTEKTKTVVEALIQVMEDHRIDEVDSIVIIGQLKDGDFIFNTNNLTMERANWLATVFKSWLLE